MQDFHEEGFLLNDGLSFRRPRADRLVIDGRVWCQGGLYFDVEQTLAVRVFRGRRQVRTVRYTFHAGVEGSRNRCVFRYDNFHAYSREEHPDAHHKHIFNHGTWEEIVPPVWVGEASRPQLSDVIEELRQWWEATGQYLDLQA
ncbi:MAG: toxin-antitoxin system TumE family protein [Thermomicrobiales bacterium]